jgi:hypothetical protein
MSDRKFQVLGLGRSLSPLIVNHRLTAIHRSCPSPFVGSRRRSVDPSSSAAVGATLSNLKHLNHLNATKANHAGLKKEKALARGFEV